MQYKKFMLLLAAAFAVLFVFLLIAVAGIGALATGGNVALIPVTGTILSSGQAGFGGTVASADTIVDFIEKADKNPSVEAIVLEINSPGGSAVGSDEIGQAIKAANKTTVAWIREVGASGGYWVASGCDIIIANRMSLTGSIGVIGSYLEFSGLMTRYNVTYERLVTGPYKDMGSPFREMTGEERRIFQKQLDIIHDYFVREVAENRNLPVEDVRSIATGAFMTGHDAKKHGLIDILGGKAEVLEYLREKTSKEPRFVRYEKKTGILDIIAGMRAGAGAHNLLAGASAAYLVQ